MSVSALISHLCLYSCLLLLIRPSLYSVCFVFPCFVVAPPPPPPTLLPRSLPLYFSLALSGKRYAMAPKSGGCGSMGIFQERDNRIAALTAVIELIRRPGSDNVITAVLRPLISPPPNLLRLRSEKWREGAHRSSFQ